MKAIYLLIVYVKNTLLTIVNSKNWCALLLFRIGLKKLSYLKFRDNDLFLFNNKIKYFPSIIIIMKLKNELKFRIKPIKYYKHLITIDNRINFVVDNVTLLDTLKLIQEQYVDDLYRLKEVSSLDGKTVIDIGANIGDSALLFASKGANVFAFEPIISTFNNLEVNIKVNQFGNLITPFNVGLSNRNQKVEIKIDPTNTIGFSSEYIKNDVGANSRVEIINLVDAISFFTKNNIKHCEILKIDCEGCENILFKDGLLIEYLKPKKIILEYHRGNDKIITHTLKRYYKKIEILQFNENPGFGMMYIDRISN